MTSAREARQRVRRVIRKLMRHWDLHDADLADAFGVSRQAMNYRLTGRTAIAPEEEAGFAAFFGVPTAVLYLPPDDALRWVLDHPEEVAGSPAGALNHAIGGYSTTHSAAMAAA